MREARRRHDGPRNTHYQSATTERQHAMTTPQSVPGPSELGHRETYTTINVHVRSGVMLTSTVYPEDARVTVDIGDNVTLYFDAAELAGFREYLEAVASALTAATEPVPA